MNVGLTVSQVNKTRHLPVLSEVTAGKRKPKGRRHYSLGAFLVGGPVTLPVQRRLEGTQERLKSPLTWDPFYYFNLSGTREEERSFEVGTGFKGLLYPLIVNINVYYF